MKALVTGASGFLGRAVVASLLNRGHSVRALVRSLDRARDTGWPSTVEVFRADLRTPAPLLPAFEGVDVVIHLAAAMSGDDAAHFASTVAGTERLLQTMSRSRTRALVLVSSFAVYGFSAASNVIDEATPTEKDVYQHGAYATAKLWQERIARRYSAAHEWDLCVLRPGIIWGAGHLDTSLAGPVLGSAQIILGWRRLPLTYVDNCADAVVLAAENSASVGQTVNVVDDEGVSVWHFAKVVGQRLGRPRWRVVVPYPILFAAAVAATSVSRLLFKGRGKLPALLVPAKLAGYRRFRFSNEKLRSFGWRPRWTFDEALSRAFDTQAGPRSGL